MSALVPNTREHLLVHGTPVAPGSHQPGAETNNGNDTSTDSSGGAIQVARVNNNFWLDRPVHLLSAGLARRAFPLRTHASLARKRVYRTAFGCLHGLLGIVLLHAAVVFLLLLLGFAPWGPVKNSIAAWWESAMGGGIDKKTFFGYLFGRCEHVASTWHLPWYVVLGCAGAQGWRKRKGVLVRNAFPGNMERAGAVNFFSGCDFESECDAWPRATESAAECRGEGQRHEARMAQMV